MPDYKAGDIMGSLTNARQLTQPAAKTKEVMKQIAAWRRDPLHGYEALPFPTRIVEFDSDRFMSPTALAEYGGKPIGDTPLGLTTKEYDLLEDV